ncbi:S49 family peptidase [Stieleria sp. JC731]|uniref:S49 family peptidase n=1 Tax=Pirellulaceae TaxID=2691357 RepID=UPI001E45E973|nr:S49 family peptidase [Stieleria sp. JC731]MCC9602828.1 S49 family peptidase [Stieleria sp. JC731]
MPSPIQSHESRREWICSRFARQGTDRAGKAGTSYLIVAVILLHCCCGCVVRDRVLKHDGKVSMSGNIAGDMRLAGKMGVDGSLRTEISMAGDKRDSALRAIEVSGKKNSKSKVAILDVDGVLVDRSPGAFIGASENPVALFREKCDAVIADKTVHAMVLRINSPGGGVTATDMMAREIHRVRESRSIPIVACLMDVGAGGAYFLATQCDYIVCHPTSLVGGVGVILNVYNLEDTMGQFNILSTPIKSGQKIDAGTPERPIAIEEETMLRDIAQSFHQRFIDRIQSRRPTMANNQEQWTDGSVFAGSQCVDVGLVDEVGYIDEAIMHVCQLANIDANAPVVLYRRRQDHAYTVLDSMSDGAVMPTLFPIKVPGLDRSSMPTFLYMWQSDPSLASSL